MSFASRVFNDVPRQSVAGMEGMFVKMWDPPAESPPTPDRLDPTNPVPEVMAAAGFQGTPSVPHTVERRLRHGDDIVAWDGQRLLFFMFSDPDNDATSGGTYPAATIRVPRGVIFHGHTQTAGGPHTIHWHGLEPTPINDGVGHCSMELGEYTYQFQPNHIGTYFYHCHRNTVQHFEFGLWGAYLVVPPDAYFATQRNPAIPIGACRDGRFRIEANLISFAQFPGFNTNPLDTPDPSPDPSNPWPFTVDPHAMTVAYDVEALWAFDDRDSVWAALATDVRQTYPVQGTVPGVNDNFHTHGVALANAAPGDFFAFNDFNADYWYVTGVSVPGPRGGSGTIAPNIVIPPALNSGVAGTQVSINAQTGQTILIRAINGAYNTIQIKMPVDVAIIAADGRALGVMPFTHYSEPFVLPAGEPIRLSVARRADGLLRFTSPFSGVATVEFYDTRGEDPSSEENLLFTALIPVNITGPVLTPPSVPAPASPANGSLAATVTPTLGWTDPTPDPLEYDVEVTPSTDAGFANPVVHARGLAAPATTFQVPARVLSPSTLYRWRVRTRNPFGASAWSAAFTFRTPAGPLPPQVLAPRGIIADLTPTLQWSAITGALFYDVEVSPSRTFTNIVASGAELAANSFTVPGGVLQLSTLYFWRVRVTTGAGMSRWALGSFRSPAGPPPPRPLAPRGIIANLTPTLEWSAVAGAISYDVEVSPNRLFADIVAGGAGLVATTFDVPAAALQGTTMYFWRVRVNNDLGPSRWSAPGIFRTPFGPRVPPVPVSPRGIIGNLTPTLEWRILRDEATSFDVQLATNPRFLEGTVLMDVTGIPAPAFTPGVTATLGVPAATLNTGSIYYWRVRGVNEFGQSVWRPSVFRTVATIP